MSGRIHDKIEEIEGYLGELESMLPPSLKEYRVDLKAKAACERYFERIVEAFVDLAYLVIKDQGFRPPEEDKKVFDVLSENALITPELAERLGDAKSMRNILAHQYGAVNDELVYAALTKELGADCRRFIQEVRKSLKASKVH